MYIVEVLDIHVYSWGIRHTFIYIVDVWCRYIVGLDASRYHHKVQAEDEDDETEARLLSEEEKYKLCTRLDITCQYKGCGRKNIIDCPLRPCQVRLLIPPPHYVPNCS